MSGETSTKKVLYIMIAFGIGCVLAIGVIFWYTRSKEPVKIGFLGEFSTFQADWTIACRDGAILRIEESNASGGIRGRQIEFIVKDIDQFKEAPNTGIDEFIRSGVIAIIGPTASSTAIKVVPYTNAHPILLVSPSASTAALSDQDDFFFRTTQTNADNARIMAAYLYEQVGWRKVAGTFTTANRMFTEGWLTAFKEQFEMLGGQMQLGDMITEESDRMKVARSLTQDAPDGIVISSHAIQVADICQEIRKMGSMVPIASSGAAHTQDLIQQGGEAVEGIILSLTFFDDDVSPEFQDFRERYLTRFEKEPSLPDVYGYEAATILIDALKQSSDWTPTALKETILSVKTFDSPLSSEGLMINEFGDVERNVVFITVKNGRFVRLE